jgi:hypothetical protein
VRAILSEFSQRIVLHPLAEGWTNLVEPRDDVDKRNEFVKPPSCQKKAALADRYHIQLG